MSRYTYSLKQRPGLKQTSGFMACTALKVWQLVKVRKKNTKFIQETFIAVILFYSCNVISLQGTEIMKAAAKSFVNFSNSPLWMAVWTFWTVR